MEMVHNKRHTNLTGETEAAAIARQNSTESLRALNGECGTYTYRSYCYLLTQNES